MPTVPPIAGAPASVISFVGVCAEGPSHSATRVVGFQEYEAQFGKLDVHSELGLAVEQFFLNGGTACWVVRAGSSPAGITPTTLDAALAALQAVPHLSLLALPGVVDPSFLDRAAQQCTAQRAFLLIDADPRAASAQELVAWVSGSALPRSASAAVYGPWLRVTDPLSGGTGLRTVPPSGSVAALFQKTDQTAGVWKAPAGPNATVVAAAPALAFQENEIAELNELGLNVLRQTAQARVEVWGARTLGLGSDQDGSYRYINVRRCALFLEASITAGTQWSVFEPNAEPLWAQLRHAVSVFMEGLYRLGAFQGATPAHAYFVKCGLTTTSQAEIEAGLINIVVGFAPLKPAEFVVISIQVQAGGCHGNC